MDILLTPETVFALATFSAFVIILIVFVMCIPSDEKLSNKDGGK